MTKARDVQPLNPKAKDTFFKRVYCSEERLKRLAAFLLGREISDITVATLKPVLYGNKENDLAFSCDGSLYVMMEEQSTPCLNISFRMVEYMMTVLRESVDTEKLLYGRKRVMLPIPKLYVLNVGIVRTKKDLPGSIMYDMRLSDSFCNDFREAQLQPDIEAVVHAYDFRMSEEEVFVYLERAAIPVRFQGQLEDMLQYALTANCLTYVQRAARSENEKRYPLPEGIRTTADLIQLLLERGIFVDLLSSKEVCDMTVAQFSREDMLRYQGREEGLEEGLERGREEGLERGREEGIRLVKSVYRLDAQGYAVSDIATELQMSVEEVKRILED